MAVTPSGSRISHNMVPSPPELLVVVRPPPSNTVNPLNLQIQLITPTPNAATRGVARTSGEYARPMDSPSSLGGNSFDAVAGATVVGSGLGTTGGGGGSLQRSPSLKSTRSGRSNSTNGSVISTNEAGSVTTSGGTRRRVTPLYNLQFHAVLTTTVTDAGTDAKVAKFLKRGIEILGLAIIDPVDLSRSPISRSLSPILPIPAPPPPASPIAATAAVVSEQATSFLSKFKRLSFRPPSKNSPTPSFSLSNPIPDAKANVVPLFRNSSPPEVAGDPSTNGAAAAPASPRSSAHAYEFTVRKWLRKDLEHDPAGVEAMEQVKFEWRRGDKRRRRGTATSSASRPGLPASFGSGSSGEEPSSTNGGPSSRTGRASRGPSPASRRSSIEISSTTNGLDPNSLAPNRAASSSRRSLRTPNSAPTTDDDQTDSEDSDVEDSDRPWLFSLSLPSRRIHLGTLTPAPHHPKLVATLAVPLSLSPVPLGEYVAGKGTSNEGLSVEEMKDVMCCSMLWLVVREGMGGTAKSASSRRGR